MSRGKGNFISHGCMTSWISYMQWHLYDTGDTVGARPAWLDEAYPECRRVDSYGVREHHGVRHNHCMSAPVYRKKVSVIVNKLVDEFGNHPGLLMWHISNEFGGECYCPHCVKRFQDYLAKSLTMILKN